MGGKIGLEKKTVIELIRKAETTLPKDVETLLKEARRREKDGIARMQLDAILENVRLAQSKSIPMCQDTGILSFRVKVGCGTDVCSIMDAIRDGLIAATKEIPLRPNLVHPLSRKNTGNNVGGGIPEINFEFASGLGYVELSVYPKGAGSENMSSYRNLNPSEGVNGVKKFVLESVAKAGGNPCPPTIVGVGLGGSASIASSLAKKALYRRPVYGKNKDEKIAVLESELLDMINRLGIGPMGLGGKTTSLKVNIEAEYCHTGSLPVAVNISCWALRKASVRLYENGRMMFL